jgi:hypothetical protein
MSQTKEEQIRRPEGNDPDPLGKLYHMSTTAGVGSQDYVAVNVVSVVAMLLGLASSLALLGTMLLVIPILAILLSIIALWQIAGSGGTQTGRLLTWGGIALAVLFASMEGTRIVAEQRQDTQDRKDIATLVDQLSQDIRQNQMDQAYALFSADFREREPMEHFVGEMRLVNDNPVYGKFVSLTTAGDIVFEGAYDEEVRAGVTQMQMQFDKHAPGALQAIFRRREGIWSIDNLPDLFPPTTPKK